MTASDAGTRHDHPRQTPSPSEHPEWRRPEGRERAELGCRRQHPAGASRDALQDPRARAELAEWLTRPGVPGALDGVAAIIARRGTGDMVDLGPAAFPFTAADAVWNALIDQERAA